MNRYRALLAALVLTSCASVAVWGEAPAPPWAEVGHATIRHAIWSGEAADNTVWRFQTVQDGEGIARAPRMALGLRLLVREAPPAARAWPWALLAVGLAGLALLMSRAKAGGRVVAVRARRRPPHHSGRRNR